MRSASCASTTAAARRTSSRCPAPWTDVAGNHSHEAYIRTVHDALRSGSALGDRLRAYQSDPSMAPFLVGPHGTATAVDVPVGRAPGD